MGCCRVYVEIFAGKDRALINDIAAACKEVGQIFQRKAHYGMSNAVYVGYDNHDGHALARGTLIADALRSLGIDAYRSDHGD